MIIINDIEQGSLEWFGIRLDCITASTFDKVVTSKGELSKQSEDFILQRAGEFLSGQCEQTYTNHWMERGKELEEDARKLFMIDHEVDVQTPGFIYKDESKTFGCSPDGIVVESVEEEFEEMTLANCMKESVLVSRKVKGYGLEIKCPAIKTHVKYLLDNKLPTSYIQQVQGSMYVTGFDYWYFMSYCPGLKPLYVKVERDQEFIDKLDEHLHYVVKRIEEVMEVIR